MPLVPNKPAPPPAERDVLVEQLAQELTREGEVGEPLIIEDPVEPGNRFFSIVVWSAWRGVPVRQRSGVIRDAYQKRDQINPQEQPKAPLLTMATGVTWEEANRKGLFPYMIEPGFHQDDKVDSQAVRDAMLAEGAIVTAAGVILLLRTREAAEAAEARLAKRLPGVIWLLTAPNDQSD